MDGHAGPQPAVDDAGAPARPSKLWHARWSGPGAVAAVFAVSLAWFSLGVERTGMASADCDPVSRIAAQDEAVYGHEAIEMAASGNWLTPVYLGRYALNKPPLLQWLAGWSVRVFGVSGWALRVPSLLAAALVSALVFAFARRLYSLPAAIGAVLLVVCSHLFYVFSRLCMTDMLLTLWLAAAMFTLLRDPALGRLSSVCVFSACAGAAIMTKGAAGALPLIALGIHAALAPAQSRPRPSRVLAAFMGAVLVATPWHLYQLVAHPRWFTAEYILTQHLSVGITAPPQYSDENHLVFYARRLFLMDPVLTVLAAVSLPLALAKRRQRPVVLAWAAVALAALFVFRYRSGYYLLPLIPVLAVLSAGLLSVLSPRARVAALAGLVACAGVKLASRSPVWGIPAGAASQRAVAPVLEAYCRMHRANDLVVVGDDDQFYASDLPLPRVRYCLIGSPPASHSERAPLDFQWLGISVSVRQFNNLEARMPVYRKRLESFNLPSVSPVATVIWAASPREVAELIEAQPTRDFLLRAALLKEIHPGGVHRIKSAGSGFALLLATAGATRRPGRACRL